MASRTKLQLLKSRLMLHSLPESCPNSYFDYFAYGSCMCPVDLKRTFGEVAHPYIVGTAKLHHYRLGFYKQSPFRHCGTLDIVASPGSVVEGVLYRLPWRFSAALDEREEVPQGGYQRLSVAVETDQGWHRAVRTYEVIHKLPQEIAPNDWYFDVVMRGAVTCGLPQAYCWQLFDHMSRLVMQSPTPMLPVSICR
jgi:cation transport regulator ChaC